ncbi:uncharacterized protein [Maniola hyperantus]|uniref:uncharacterized protein n=1 Tax=Aphantopus hyperantus TaxID=2795564 RepID=UPI00374857E9
MFYKCLMCFVFVALPIECLFKGESCTADHRLGTCKQLSKCTHLMNEIRHCGTPMPPHMRDKLKRLGCGFDYDEPLVRLYCTCKQLSKCTHLMNEIRHCGTPMPPHMRDKLKRLGCGFDYDEPLVCCDSSSNTAYTERPFSGDSWGSHEYGKEDRYDKGPHYDADQNDWTTKPSSNTWGSGGTHGRDPLGSGGTHGRDPLGSGGTHGRDPLGSGGTHGRDPLGSGGTHGRDPLGSGGTHGRDPLGSGGTHGRDPLGSGGTHGSDPWGSSESDTSGSSESNTWGSSGSNTWGSSGSNTWGSGGNQDPYNTGGGKDPYANNGGGNKDDRNNNNKWDSNKNTVDNSIERIPDVRNHRNLDILPIECGAIEGERIFGGNRTKLFEMPWMVLLSYDSARGTKLSCGGSLISEWYVLTAAHCISFLGTKLKLRSVILGEYDVRRDPDCERMEGELFCAPKVRNVAVDTVIPHPDYSPQRLGDDIGLIRLAEPADFTLDSMKPICLPTSPELQSENLEGLNGVVAGWGATEDGLQSPVLLSVDLPIISNRDCQALYNGSPRIDKSQLCAGGIRDKDSCGGDSGGPLLYPGRTRAGAGVRYVQRGIVSYGSKRCGLGGFPGVYTRVANYMDWILDNIR